MEKQGKPKSKDWNSYYKGHDKVVLSNILLHWQYLFSVIRSRPKKILEIGCGPADHSIIIKKYYKSAEVSLLDFDQNILKGLKKKYGRKFKNYYHCDITNSESIKSLGFTSKQFDVIFSQGLLEHFKEDTLAQIIGAFVPFTKEFIASIPSDSYPTLDFGNEILRGRKDMEKIFSKVPGIKYKVKEYKPDIGVRTKLIQIKKKKLAGIPKVKYILFGSSHLLIDIVNK